MKNTRHRGNGFLRIFIQEFFSFMNTSASIYIHGYIKKFNEMEMIG